MSIDIGATNTILIIEPNEQVREMLVEVFKNNNFKVLEASDGADGLSKASNEGKLDIILSGLNMPRMDGLEFMQEKNENEELKNIPVVIYDNIASEEEKEKVLATGAKDFIIEGTVTPDEIIQRVARAMQQGDYLFQVDPYALDAQSFISDYHLNKNFKCNNCGTDLALKLSAYKGKDMIAKIVCPSCGQKYL